MPEKGRKSEKMFEISKKISPVLLCAAFVLAMLFCGCRSDRFHQNRSADEAREFLLKNAPELTPAQVAYVKYNDPFLLTGEGLAGKVTGIRQVCIAWDIPGTQKLYMVFGVARERMDNWYPNRLIRKNFVKPSADLNSAVQTCRTFAVTNFLETLSERDLNSIRFSDPDIVITDFVLRSEDSINNPNDTSLNKFDADDLFENEIKKELADRKSAEDTGLPTQISLLWKISNHRYAVFCGLAQNESLAGWKINFAGLKSDIDTNTAIKKFLKKPGSFNTPIPIPEKPAVANLKKATEKCRIHAEESMKKALSNEALEIIRDVSPGTAITSFRDGNESDTQLQISLLWKISDEHYAVFCGSAKDIQLTDWNISFAGIKENYETETSVKEFLKKPAEYTPQEKGK